MLLARDRLQLGEPLVKKSWLYCKEQEAGVGNSQAELRCRQCNYNRRLYN